MGYLEQIVMNKDLVLPVRSGCSREVAEWIEAFDDIVVDGGPDQGAEILAALGQRAREAGIDTPSEVITPYMNTIPRHEEVPYPLPDSFDVIGPLNAIYQARFMRYLENRNLLQKTPRKVWAYIGDGETDEVDTRGTISVASREALDNLIFVVNCNLQRLDGPVRGNKRIIAASDYMKAVPDQLAPWLAGRLVTLGTDGFGRSDNREHLRCHFEVSAESIVAATLTKLARGGKVDTARAQEVFAEIGLDTEKDDPARQ
jgi:pyruvate dehydrogenase complex dehydrogenase (E1) component